MTSTSTTNKKCLYYFKQNKYHARNKSEIGWLEGCWLIVRKSSLRNLTMEVERWIVGHEHQASVVGLFGWQEQGKCFFTVPLEIFLYLKIKNKKFINNYN